MPLRLHDSCLQRGVRSSMWHWWKGITSACSVYRSHSQAFKRPCAEGISASIKEALGQLGKARGKGNEQWSPASLCESYDEEVATQDALSHRSTSAPLARRSCIASMRVLSVTGRGGRLRQTWMSSGSRPLSSGGIWDTNLNRLLRASKRPRREVLAHA